MKRKFLGGRIFTLRASHPELINLNIFLFLQYCEYYPEYDKCKQWLERNLPSEFEKVQVNDDGDGATEEEKKRQKRGGKGMLKTKKKDEGPKQVYVSRAPRGKKKSVTVVTGLNSFGKKFQKIDEINIAWMGCEV